MKFTTLKINLETKEISMNEIQQEGIYGIIDYAIYLHDEVYKTYELDPYDPKNVTVFGKGPFAGSVLPGAHRLVFVFRSPLYGTLFPSTMGGAAYIFQRVGVDFVVLEGKREKPTVILLQGDGENVSVELHEIELEKVLEIWHGYKGEEGVYALTEYLIDNFKDKFDSEFRIACVGPASLNTNFGAIFSQT